MKIAEKILLESHKLFVKYGVKSVSMDDIANSLGMSKKTIYSVYENKKHLVKSVIIAYVDSDILELKKIIAASENAIAEMLFLGQHYYKFLREMKPSLVYDLKKYHRQTYTILEKKHKTFIQKVIKDNIHRGIKENIYHDDIDPTMISTFYIITSKNLIEEDLFPRGSYPMEDLFIAHLRYHLRGLVNEEGKRLLEVELMKNKDYV